MALHHRLPRQGGREPQAGNGLSRQPPPSAEAMAASAACACEPSGPPACAMSERPPPLLPPSATAPLRARSTAEKRAVRSSVTPTTMPALPSSLTPTMATIPEPTRFLPSSARLRRSLRSMPSTARAIRRSSPITRMPSPTSERKLLSCLGELALEPPALFEHLSEAVRHLLERCLELGSGGLCELGQVIGVLARCLRGECLDAAHA